MMTSLGYIWFSLNTLINLLWKEFIKIKIFVMKKNKMNWFSFALFFPRKHQRLNPFEDCQFKANKIASRQYVDNERLNDLHLFE